MLRAAGAWLPRAAVSALSLGGSSHFGSCEAQVCPVINVCGSCNVHALGLWEQSDLRACQENKIPELCSSLLWFYTCVRLGSVLFLTINCLVSLSTCSPSPSGSWAEWERERGNEGKELPSCMRRASKKGSRCWEEGRDCSELEAVPLVKCALRVVPRDAAVKARRLKLI